VDSRDEIQEVLEAREARERERQEKGARELADILTAPQGNPGMSKRYTFELSDEDEKE
jgi:hypothetical protein